MRHSGTNTLVFPPQNGSWIMNNNTEMYHDRKPLDH